MPTCRHIAIAGSYRYKIRNRSAKVYLFDDSTSKSACRSVNPEVKFLGLFLCIYSLDRLFLLGSYHWLTEKANCEYPPS
ncbi:hypothetical protein [Chamaesiphon sp. VAR_48_metabat_403]|uniref:hypothetical protein n=1 Tax=Chamaesiphon sp. VAR_48_metabat_403 TaxID=2964700 RepID=UPI00286E8D8F|nr:hypothetical protein [Chamaesiphon sp. VAR_48_metabat_403]